MSQSRNKKVQIGFRLKTVQVTECAFRKPEQEIQKNQNFGFSFSFGVNFDNDEKAIAIEIGIKIFFSPEQKKKLGTIVSNTIFKIQDFEKFVSVDNYEFPEDFIIMLMSISFSTLRGIVVEKTASTLQHSIILPIINVKEIIKNQKSEKVK